MHKEDMSRLTCKSTSLWTWTSVRWLSSGFSNCAVTSLAMGLQLMAASARCKRASDRVLFAAGVVWSSSSSSPGRPATSAESNTMMASSLRSTIWSSLEEECVSLRANFKRDEEASS